MGAYIVLHAVAIGYAHVIIPSPDMFATKSCREFCLAC